MLPAQVNYRLMEKGLRYRSLLATVELVVLLQQAAGNDQPLDLAGALVDFRNARVPVVSLRWHIGHVAHAAKHLDGLSELSSPNLRK